MKSPLLLSAVALLASTAFIPAAEASATNYCREFNRDIVIDGRVQQGYGIACLQPDGSWEIQPSTNSYGRNVVTYNQPTTYYDYSYTPPATTRYVTTTRVDYVDPTPYVVGTVALGALWWGLSDHSDDHWRHHTHNKHCNHGRGDRDWHDAGRHNGWDRDRHGHGDRDRRYSRNW